MTALLGLLLILPVACVVAAALYNVDLLDADAKVSYGLLLGVLLLGLGLASMVTAPVGLGLLVRHYVRRFIRPARAAGDDTAEMA